MHLVYNPLAVVVLNDIGEGVILVHAMICSLIASRRYLECNHNLLVHILLTGQFSLIIF